MKNTKYVKKTIALGLAAAAVAGCMTGCSGKKEAETETDGKYNLRVMTYDYFGNPMMLEPESRSR